jgi:hypothetical protein
MEIKGATLLYTLPSGKGASPQNTTTDLRNSRTRRLPEAEPLQCPISCGFGMWSGLLPQVHWTLIAWSWCIFGHIPDPAPQAF